MRRSIALLIFMAAAVPLVAFAHNGATGIVGERMAAMTEMGQALKTLVTLPAQNVEPDGEASELLSTLKTLGAQLPNHFTDQDLSQGSEARPKIWNQPQDFQAAVDLLNARIELADEVLASGDATAFKTALRGVGQACASCHSDFRAEN